MRLHWMRRRDGKLAIGFELGPILDWDERVGRRLLIFLIAHTLVVSYRKDKR